MPDIIIPQNTIQSVAAGDYDVIVEKTGYVTQIKPATVLSNQLTVVDFTLVAGNTATTTIQPTTTAGSVGNRQVIVGLLGYTGSVNLVGTIGNQSVSTVLNFSAGSTNLPIPHYFPDGQLLTYNLTATPAVNTFASSNISGNFTMALTAGNHVSFLITAITTTAAATTQAPTTLAPTTTLIQPVGWGYTIQGVSFPTVARVSWVGTEEYFGANPSNYIYNAGRGIVGDYGSFSASGKEYIAFGNFTPGASPGTFFTFQGTSRAQAAGRRISGTITYYGNNAGTQILGTKTYSNLVMTEFSAGYWGYVLPNPSGATATTTLAPTTQAPTTTGIPMTTQAPTTTLAPTTTIANTGPFFRIMFATGGSVIAEFPNLTGILSGTIGTHANPGMFTLNQSISAAPYDASAYRYTSPTVRFPLETVVVYNLNFVPSSISLNTSGVSNATIYYGDQVPWNTAININRVSIAIDSNRPDTVGIYLNGTFNSYTGTAGQTIFLNPGTHNFRFTAAGYPDIITTLTVVSGQQPNTYTAIF